MPVALMLEIQAVAGPPAPVSPRPRVERPCPVEDGSGDVIVCGRANQEAFRLRALRDGGSAGPPKAEVELFGRAKIATETEQGDVGGIPTNRIMLRLKLPF